MPVKLSVRAFAKLLALPAYDQLRVLHDQKHPKQAPQIFRIPFYQTALAGIRAYYRSANDPAPLIAARQRASNLKPASKKQHNRRVLDQFEQSPQSDRKLVLEPVSRISVMVSGISVSLQFDLVAAEGAKKKFILYNFRDALIDTETARSTVEIAHWMLEDSGVKVPIGNLEYVNLSNGSSCTTKRRRKTTIVRAQRNAQIIQTLWPTI